MLAVINLGYLISYQLGGLLTYGLGITANEFKNLWILVLLSAIFPLLTQILLLCLPEKYDVNEEIAKYFKMKREQKQVNRKNSIDCESIHTGSIRVKTNIRDDIDDEDYLID